MELYQRASCVLKGCSCKEVYFPEAMNFLHESRNKPSVRVANRCRQALVNLGVCENIEEATKIIPY